MSSSNGPAIGVVVINWNGAHDTRACLESLNRCQPRPERVVVVDNASADDSMTRLAAWPEENRVTSALFRNADIDEAGPREVWLTFLVASRNLGYAGGNNVGLRYLLNCREITHCLLLNNDATLAPEAVARIRDVLKSRPQAGLLTGTIYEHPAHDKVWYAGGHEIPYRAVIVHDLKVPVSPEPIPTKFVSGCLMLVSRALLENVGLLPECYFPLYYEDAEYSARALAANYEVLYAPSVTAFHKVGATVGAAKTSPFVTRVQVRNRILYVRRNFHGLMRGVALGYLAVTKPGRALVEAAKGRVGMAAAFLRGTLEGFLE